jgi:NAD-dependent dihydropyrimidine dehydrogenase PreA subunit
MISRTGNHSLNIDEKCCLACGACVPVCAFDAIFLRGWGIEILDDECTLCNICVQVCPTGALSTNED